MAKSVSLKGLGEYEEIPKEALLASQFLADKHIALGQPQTPFTPAGQKMMDSIIKVWEILYPLDYETFMAERRDYKKNEMSISEQVHQKTGRSLASYPLPIYKMMKRIFKGFDSAKRENCMRMIRLWPIFQFANKA